MRLKSCGAAATDGARVLADRYRAAFDGRHLHRAAVDAAFAGLVRRRRVELLRRRPAGRRGSRSGNLLLRRRLLGGGLRCRLRLLLNDLDGRQLVRRGGGAGVGGAAAFGVVLGVAAFGVVALGAVVLGAGAAAPPAGGVGCVCGGSVCWAVTGSESNAITPAAPPAAIDLCPACRPPAFRCYFRFTPQKLD